MFIFSYRTYLYLLIYWKYVGIYTCCLVFNIDANGNGANRTGQMGNATLPPFPCTVGLEGIAALCIQLNYHVAIGCANGAVANGNVWYRVHRTACSLHAALSSFFKMPHHEPWFFHPGFGCANATGANGKMLQIFYYYSVCSFPWSVFFF